MFPLVGWRIGTVVNYIYVFLVKSLNLLQGIQFYEQLLSLYESEFSLSVSDCLLWPSGFPSDDLASVHAGNLPVSEVKRSTLQV